MSLGNRLGVRKLARILAGAVALAAVWHERSWAVHIADNALSPGVLGVGTAVAVAGTAIGLARLAPEKLPRVGMLSATFFVASFIFIPVPPTSVHLILNGLVGILLGWSAFPAFLVALFLQSLYGFGGMTVIGVNTAVIAVPAICCYHVFAPRMRTSIGGRAFLYGFLSGALAIVGTCVLLSLSLYLSGEEGEFLVAAWTAAVGHVPVMLVEGLVTGAAVVFLQKVRPDLLAGTLPPPGLGKEEASHA